MIKGYWRFNGNSNDASGNNNNGTDTDIAYSQANGRLNQGARFNGSTSVIQTPFISMTSGTISLWSKNPKNKNSELIVFNQNTLNSNNYLQIMLLPDGRLFIYHPTLIDTTFNGVFDANKWTHILITQTGSSISVYRDAKFISSYSTSVWASSVTSANQICIGALKRSTQIYDQNNDSMDEVIIDNTVWTPAKIKNEYSQVKGHMAIL